MGVRPVHRARVALLAGLIAVVATVVLAQAPTLQRVDGATLAARVLGQAGPWIVFESGLAEGADAWGRVAGALASCARVVLYDRAGIGGSTPRKLDGPVLASRVSVQLRQLMQGIGAEPPFVLVGHSLGGLYVQSFARQYPSEVAAVVLVDAASPFEPPGVFVSTKPPDAGSTAAWEEAGVAPSVAAMLAGPPFPAIPLVVLAATDHGDAPERERLWQNVQARTAQQSPKGRLKVIEGSGHFIQNDRPQAVVTAVVEAARDAGFDISKCASTGG